MTPTDEISEKIKEKVELLNVEVDRTCEQLKVEADGLKNRAESSRRQDIWVRSITAVLAIATPALVTYSATAGVADIYKLLAILLTGIAGAASTLQAVFGLRQAYMRNANAALNLRQIIRDLRSSVEEANSNQDALMKPGLIKSALDKARQKADEVTLLAEKSQIAEYGQV